MYCPVLLEYIRLVWPPTRDVGRCPQVKVKAAMRYSIVKTVCSLIIDGAKYERDSRAHADT